VPGNAQGPDCEPGPQKIYPGEEKISSDLSSRWEIEGPLAEIVDFLLAWRPTDPPRDLRPLVAIQALLEAVRAHPGNPRGYELLDVAIGAVSREIARAAA
jgi:hypothetical protein